MTSKRKRFMNSIALCLLPHLGVWALKPNDPSFRFQWSLENDGSFSLDNIPVAKAGADMKMTSAWNITQGDSTIIVAIIDSGCRWQHPEFLGRIWTNRDEIDSNGIDDDRNGYIDDMHGWNFVDDNADIRDKDTHGTSITSLIGANANNNLGIAGVDWHCKLMIISLASLGAGVYPDQATKAIRYAVDNGARIVNMSVKWGNGTNPVNAPTIDAAVKYGLDKGVVFVGGTGNDDIEFINYPASIPGVIAVGSTDPADRLSHIDSQGASGSNYGARIDIVAPGNFVLAMDTDVEDFFSRLGSGTSNSTAFVSGICALLLAQNPSLNAAQILDILRNSADDQVGRPSEDTPGWDKYHGAGRVNAYRALTYQAGTIRGRISTLRNTRGALGPLTERVWQGRKFTVDGKRLMLSISPIQR